MRYFLILLFVFMGCRAQDFPHKIGYYARATVSEVRGDIAILKPINQPEIRIEVANHNYQKSDEYFWVFDIKNKDGNYVKAEVLLVNPSLRQIRQDKDEGIAILSKQGIDLRPIRPQQPTLGSRKDDIIPKKDMDEEDDIIEVEGKKYKIQPVERAKDSL